MRITKKKSALTLSILIVATLLYFAWNYLYSDRNSEISSNNQVSLIVEKSEESIIEKLNSNNEELIEILNRKNIIITLLGTDERSTETSRSDIIMVIKYYPVENKAVLISIPRDTRVEIPGIKLDKINHAFAFGGPELSKKTIENLLGITSDYYIKFSFEDFKMIVDDFGGVKVNAIKDFENDGVVQVPKGEQLINGEDALFYVRFRSDGEGDYGRIKRQQEVVESLSHIIKNANREEILSILDKTYENIVTNMELLEMINYLTLIESKDEVKIYERTLKTSSIMIDKIYYAKYDEQDLAEIQELLNE